MTRSSAGAGDRPIIIQYRVAAAEERPGTAVQNRDTGGRPGFAAVAGQLSPDRDRLAIR
jgi:hypothetical protein